MAAPGKAVDIGEEGRRPAPWVSQGGREGSDTSTHPYKLDNLRKCVSFLLWENRIVRALKPGAENQLLGLRSLCQLSA